eukprot:g20323.t1
MLQQGSAVARGGLLTSRRVFTNMIKTSDVDVLVPSRSLQLAATEIEGGNNCPPRKVNLVTEVRGGSVARSYAHFLQEELLGPVRTRSLKTFLDEDEDEYELTRAVPHCVPAQDQAPGARDDGAGAREQTADDMKAQLQTHFAAVVEKLFPRMSGGASKTILAPNKTFFVPIYQGAALVEYHGWRHFLVSQHSPWWARLCGRMRNKRRKEVQASPSGMGSAASSAGRLISGSGGGDDDGAAAEEEVAGTVDDRGVEVAGGGADAAELASTAPPSAPACLSCGLSNSDSGGVVVQGTRAEYRKSSYTRSYQNLEDTYACFREMHHPGARWKPIGTLNLNELQCPGFSDNMARFAASETRECFLVADAADRKKDIKDKDVKHKEKVDLLSTDRGEQVLSDRGEQVDTSAQFGLLFVFHSTTVGKRDIISATWRSVRQMLKTTSRERSEIIGFRVLMLGGLHDQDEYSKAMEHERKKRRKEGAHVDRASFGEQSLQVPLKNVGQTLWKEGPAVK